MLLVSRHRYRTPFADELWKNIYRTETMEKDRRAFQAKVRKWVNSRLVLFAVDTPSGELIYNLEQNTGELNLIAGMEDTLEADILNHLYVGYSPADAFLEARRYARLLRIRLMIMTKRERGRKWGI